MTGRLLHADTAGFVLVANNVDVWSDVHPDLASAQEEQAEIVTPTVVFALVGLELFEPELPNDQERQAGKVDRWWSSEEQRWVYYYITETPDA